MHFFQKLLILITGQAYTACP